MTLNLWQICEGEEVTTSKSVWIGSAGEREGLREHQGGQMIQVYVVGT